MEGRRASPFMLLLANTNNDDRLDTNYKKEDPGEMASNPEI